MWPLVFRIGGVFRVGMRVFIGCPVLQIGLVSNSAPRLLEISHNLRDTPAPLRSRASGCRVLLRQNVFAFLRSSPLVRCLVVGYIPGVDFIPAESLEEALLKLDKEAVIVLIRCGDYVSH